MSSAPIGFFDSGAGGVTVWQAAARLLPAENMLYLADSAHAPYGDQTPEDIIRLTLQAVEFLAANGCKAIVLACNTATVNAASAVREKFSIPIIGLEPAVKPAALMTRTKHIGLLATRSTLASARFREHTAQLAADGGAVLHSVAAAGVVDLIERGESDSPAMAELLDIYTAPFLAAGVDVVVLGCTHYPHIRAQIASRLPNAVVIDSANAVARQLQRVLAQRQLLNEESKPARCEWLTTGDAAILQRFLPDGGTAVRIIL